MNKKQRINLQLAYHLRKAGLEKYAQKLELEMKTTDRLYKVVLTYIADGQGQKYNTVYYMIGSQPKIKKYISTLSDYKLLTIERIFCEKIINLNSNE